MNIEILDDLKSIFHLLLGFITPITPRLGLIIALIYFLYQSWEKEKMRDKRGDVIEFLIGAGGWALVHSILEAL